MNKLIKINSIIFFIGWTTILLAGADKPPPVGFLWLVGLVVMLDLVQAIYLKSFIKILEVSKIKAFIYNCIFFLCGAAIVSILTLVSSNIRGIFLNVNEMIIWSVVLTAVSSIYGCIFYCFNILLFNKMKNKGEI